MTNERKESREHLNKLLVGLFHKVLNIEERALKKGEFSDLTIASMHTISAIGDETDRSMASIAQELSITAGTLSISVDLLVKKGYVDRRRSEDDRRVVNLTLTEKGKQAFQVHKKFHQEMIEGALGDLTPSEEKILVKAIDKVIRYFETSY